MRKDNLARVIDLEADYSSSAAPAHPHLQVVKIPPKTQLQLQMELAAVKFEWKAQPVASGVRSGRMCCYE